MMSRKFSKFPYGSDSHYAVVYVILKWTIIILTMIAIQYLSDAIIIDSINRGLVDGPPEVNTPMVQLMHALSVSYKTLPSRMLVAILVIFSAYTLMVSLRKVLFKLSTSKSGRGRK